MPFVRWLRQQLRLKVLLIPLQTICLPSLLSEAQDLRRGCPVWSVSRVLLINHWAANNRHKEIPDIWTLRSTTAGTKSSIVSSKQVQFQLKHPLLMGQMLQGCRNMILCPSSINLHLIWGHWLGLSPAPTINEGKHSLSGKIWWLSALWGAVPCSKIKKTWNSRKRCKTT